MRFTWRCESIMVRIILPMKSNTKRHLHFHILFHSSSNRRPCWKTANKLLMDNQGSVLATQAKPYCEALYMQKCMRKKCKNPSSIVTFRSALGNDSHIHLHTKSHQQGRGGVMHLNCGLRVEPGEGEKAVKSNRKEIAQQTCGDTDIWWNKH